MSNVSALLTAIATILLVGVTWGYARTTKKMAEDSARSTRAAEEAAKASNAAAEAAISGLSVQFVIRPMGQADVDKGSWAGLELLCTGATVFVHDVELLDYAVLVDKEHGYLSEHTPFTDQNALPSKLEITDPQMPARFGFPDIERMIPEMPVQMFSGDIELFQFPEGVDFEDRDLYRATAVVTFSVSKDGPTSRRRVRGKASVEDLLLWHWPVEQA